jgi:hypothetical protein
VKQPLHDHEGFAHSLRFERATPDDAEILAHVSKQAFHSDIHCGATEPGGPIGYDSDLWQIRMMTKVGFVEIGEDGHGGVLLERRLAEEKT